MFLFFIGVICGIVVGQELDGLPKLKPKIIQAYEKLFTNDTPSKNE
jgi:hypothetical protein